MESPKQPAIPCWVVRWIHEGATQATQNTVLRREENNKNAQNTALRRMGNNKNAQNTALRRVGKTILPLYFKSEFCFARNRIFQITATEWTLTEVPYGNSESLSRLPSYGMYNLVTRNASNTLSKRRLTGDHPANLLEGKITCSTQFNLIKKLIYNLSKKGKVIGDLQEIVVEMTNFRKFAIYPPQNHT